MKKDRLPTDREIGYAIKVLRSFSMMSGADLADLAGISSNHVSSIESGARALTDYNLDIILQHFELNKIDFLEFAVNLSGINNNDIISKCKILGKLFGLIIVNIGGHQ